MKNLLRKVEIGIGLAVVSIMVFTASAFAAGGYSLFGDAHVTMPGNHSSRAIRLDSDTHRGVGYAGINFTVASSLTFANITNLGTDYDFIDNTCNLGSPRFQINIAGVNAFVYIGPPANYTGCPVNTWVTTGNLATPTSFIDTSQLPGGTFYDTFTSADLKYGADVVTGIQLVDDAGFSFLDGHQTVNVDNVVINAQTYTFEKKGH